ncbi:MAG: hypothetical protein IJT98_02955 [Prevotella sp.]|nr:hypothetical protein [Prevotella sp.]
MKKTYIIPVTNTIVVEAAQTLLAGSEKVNFKSGTASEWGSRQASQWDDDDEE